MKVSIEWIRTKSDARNSYGWYYVHSPKYNASGSSSNKELGLILERTVL